MTLHQYKNADFNCFHSKVHLSTKIILLFCQPYTGFSFNLWPFSASIVFHKILTFTLITIYFVIFYLTIFSFFVFHVKPETQSDNLDYRHKDYGLEPARHDILR